MNGLKELAEQAGLYFYEFVWTSPTDECMYPEGVYQEALERFAKLVAAKEREACAKLCDDLDDDLPDGLAGWQYGEAIRARGEA